MSGSIYERFEKISDVSAERDELVARIRRYLPADEVIEGWIGDFSELPKAKEIVVTGHHLHHPFIRFVFEHPGILEEVGEGRKPNRIGAAAITEATKMFAEGILDSKRPADYIKDLFGETEEDVRIYVRRIAYVFYSLLSLEDDCKVTIQAKTPDIICKQCIGGEHCVLVGDSWSEEIDALWVGEAVWAVDGRATVLDKMTRRRAREDLEYITRAEMPMKTFRMALAELAVVKAHLYKKEE